METVIESDCTFTHEGKSFTASGSYFVNLASGFVAGGVYVNEKNRTVTTWHGDFIAKLDSMTDYHGNFCEMQRISFTYHGMKFVGDYCPDWAQYCKVRSTKKVN